MCRVKLLTDFVNLTQWAGVYDFPKVPQVGDELGLDIEPKVFIQSVSVKLFHEMHPLQDWDFTCVFGPSESVSEMNEKTVYLEECFLSEYVYLEEKRLKYNFWNRIDHKPMKYGTSLGEAFRTLNVDEVTHLDDERLLRLPITRPTAFYMADNQNYKAVRWRREEDCKNS